MYLCNETINYILQNDVRFFEATTVVRNHRHNYEKWYCFGSHNQCKHLLKGHMVRLKIISLYIYKELRLKT